VGAVQDGDDPHRDALSAWFSPEIAAALLAARQGQEPRHLTGEPARFAAQFGWQRLSRLLEWHPLEPARLHLVRGGETLDPATFRKQSKDGTTRLIAGALANQLDRGATLVLNHAHELDPALCALADAIAEELQVRCGANIYASLRGEAGLALHWDEHDVFVLQIAGRKHWRVHAAVAGEPFGLPPHRCRARVGGRAGGGRCAPCPARLGAQPRAIGRAIAACHAEPDRSRIRHAR
jgi:hypothetical protein